LQRHCVLNCVVRSAILHTLPNPSLRPSVVGTIKGDDVNKLRLTVHCALALAGSGDD